MFEPEGIICFTSKDTVILSSPHSSSGRDGLTPSEGNRGKVSVGRRIYVRIVVPTYTVGVYYPLRSPGRVFLPSSF